MHAVVDKKMYLTMGKVTFEVTRKFLGDPPPDAMHFCVTMTYPYYKCAGDFLRPELLLMPRKEQLDEDIIEYMEGLMFFDVSQELLDRHMKDYDESVEARLKQELASS